MLDYCRSAMMLFVQGLLAALLCSGCAAPDSADTQVRQVLAELEHAAEARDTRRFADRISAQYHDDEDRDAAAIASLARGYFLVNQSIHLLSRVERIDFPTNTEARVKITVGTIGNEADPTNSSVAAEVHDFDVTLSKEDGEWRVIYARWQRPG
jgi:outer membrane biogenesis lipoprotein LolB